jgi:energy-coupling factor transporter ATP-binding protein EcfA2
MEILLNMLSGGIKHGELSIITAGRHSGKSTLVQFLTGAMPERCKFKITDRTLVDGEQWYTVECNKIISTWIRSQSSDMFYELTDGTWEFINIFEIHGKLYTVLALRWS